MSLITGLLIASAAAGVSSNAGVVSNVSSNCDLSHSRVSGYADPRPNFLGTTALPIRADRFSDSWRRASMGAGGSVAFQQLIAPARNLCRASQLAYVQTAIHRAIRWRSDATQWGQHDYWASAWETLSKGAGDTEDLAILKMQALRSLGFSPQDLFITMGRDTVAGPVTLLIVRMDNRYYLLNDTGGSPSLLEARRKEFQPQITLSSQGAFVHAQTIAVGSSLGMSATGRARK